MKTTSLSLAQARKIILHAAGLARHAQFGKGKEAVYKFIDHIGFVQLDTIHVVARAHHHTLYARVPDYTPAWLDELQDEARVFEFWTYACGYMPMHDFPYSLPVKDGFVARRKALTTKEVNLMEHILDRIGREGPLMAKDFDSERVTKSTGWWDWRPAKVALERLHLDGRLMVWKRKGFQKVYDLTENIIWGEANATPPTTDAFYEHVIRRSLQTLGIASAKDIAFPARYIKNASKALLPVLQKLVATGEVREVSIEQGPKGPLYMLPTYLKKKITLPGDVFILSPFDIVNVHRHRLHDFFAFDYQVECFVPAPKRKYGYFSLPILAGDTFIARMDAKADRKQHVFTIHNLHFEKVTLSKATRHKLIEAIRAFVVFNECDRMVIKKSNQKPMVKVIREAFG